MASERIRVLIADDHPLFREGVASSLASSWALPRSSLMSLLTVA